jgi:Tn3 transposase DDE domain-containing protein
MKPGDRVTMTEAALSQRLDGRKHRRKRRPKFRQGRGYWGATRPTICRSLGHSLSAEETLAGLGRQLNHVYRQVAANLTSNQLARVESVEGKYELVLTALDKLDEPQSLVRLRDEIARRLPRVDLPEILLEVAARTDFAAKFTHVSERESRVDDLTISICAVLLAEACNIGFDRSFAAIFSRSAGPGCLGSPELYQERNPN